MVRKWESIFFIGLLLIPFLLVILFYRPTAQPREMYINVVNTNGWLRAVSGASVDVSIAKLKLGLNEQQHLDDFPYDIDLYHGIDSGDLVSIKSRLIADTMLMRTYYNSDSSTPLYLVIVHSTSSVSAHPPPLCYETAGYTVLEKGQVAIPLTDNDLISRVKETDPGEEGGSLIDRIFTSRDLKAEITVNTLIVAMVEDEEVTERRLVFYTYLTDKEFLESEYCLLRISAVLPTEGPYDDVTEAMRGFMGTVFSILFEDISEPPMTLFNQLTEQGAKGISILALLFTIPALMVGYPLATRKISGKAKDTETEHEESAEEPDGIVLTEREFNLPYDPDEKSGNDKILAYYHNSRYVIEQCIDINTDSASTLRQFLNMAESELPDEAAGHFSALTKLAETTVYAKREPEEGIITEAGRLAGAILRLMKDIPQ